MKTVKNIIVKSLLSSVVLIGMCSGCSQEDQLVPSEPDGKSKEVVFSINIPGASPTDTRALGNSEENEVTSIEMLLFDPSTKKMVHNPVYANVITPDPNDAGNITKKSFSVRLPQGTYDIVIFANARKAFNGVTLTSGENQEAVFAKLKVTMPATGWITNPADQTKGYLIPMWGMKENVSVGQGTTITGIYLHRMVSRIDVKVTGANAQTGNFILKDIKLYNIQKEGRIAPVMANWSKNGLVNNTVAAGLALSPSLVPVCGVYPSISYGSAITQDGKSCEGGIYLFEASKAAAHADLNAPYLTVKGSFEGIEGWYRIDLADYSTMNYLPVLRNHLYKINITEVTGRGYSTEEEAKNNRGENIVVEIILWNEYELGGMVYNGQYFLSVDPPEVTYDHKAHARQMITIKTDCNTPMTLSGNIMISDSESDSHAGFTGNWINNVSLSSKSVVNNINVYTLTYNVNANNGLARTGYVHVTVDRLTIAVRITQMEDNLTVTPDYVLLSPFVSHRAKTVRITSNGPWELVAQPANATVSPANGSGATDITVTRSATTFGLSTFTIRHTITNQTVTVTVDNCFFYEDELFLSNAPGDNTGVYTIEMAGGREAYTIVGYSPWITSATILPNGDLQLVAPHSEDGLSGYITLAHADDPDYQITYPVLQDVNGLPPFDYLTMRFTWSKGDADFAVEFAGNELPASPGTYPPFDNMRYYPDLGKTRSVGYGQIGYISVDGSRGGSSSGVPVYTPEELRSGLMFWGGDARAGEGETVFINAPQVTPPSRREDRTGWSRYLNIEVYATWWSGSGTSPITVAVCTYTGGIMLKPVENDTNENLYKTNFYNVAAGTDSLTLSSQVLSPEFNEAYTFDCSVHVNSVAGFRSTYQHVCTIRYDRYRRSANITWY